MPRKRTSGVYILRNNINSDTYIGSSVTIQGRKIHHISKLNADKHWIKKLQQLFNEYGRSSIYFEILELVPDHNDLKDREQYWLDTLQPTYNTCKNSRNTEGRPCSERTKKRLSEANTGNKYWVGKKHTEESKIKIGLASKSRPSSFKGKHHTEENKRKFSERMKGVKTFLGKNHSEESKRKISEARKRPILNTETGIYYDFVGDAAASIPMPQGSLSNMMCGFRKNKTSFIYA